jgi:hypothetical protein
MLRIFVLFAFLQVVDLGSTVAVLRCGGTEQNPLIQQLMILGPIQGIIVAKVLALAVGVGCYWAHKPRALRLANLVFGCIVVWNLTILARLF